MDVKAHCYVEVRFEDEWMDMLAEKENYPQPLLFFGGGSNLLFLNDYKGTVVRVMTKGITTIFEDERHILVNVAAGEPWDDFVAFAVKNGWGGLENLSLIPGMTGTAPVQNIGAYGVEVKDVVTSVEAVNIETQEKIVLTNQECEFGYRDSIFKRRMKSSHLIVSVTFRLDKQPVLNTSYGMIQKELERRGVAAPNIHDVRDVVCAIRRSKLPDPAVMGNAGSFFKNPVISVDNFEKLLSRFPAMVHFPQGAYHKIAAAWLIEQCGWKGKRMGDVGVHENQPLVLVNYGNATGAQIMGLAKAIIDSVEERFGIRLEPEVNIIG